MQGHLLDHTSVLNYLVCAAALCALVQWSSDDSGNTAAAELLLLFHSGDTECKGTLGLFKITYDSVGAQPQLTVHTTDVAKEERQKTRTIPRTFIAPLAQSYLLHNTRSWWPVKMCQICCGVTATSGTALRKRSELLFASGNHNFSMTKGCTNK